MELGSQSANSYLPSSAPFIPRFLVGRVALLACVKYVGVYHYHAALYFLLIHYIAPTAEL